MKLILSAAALLAVIATPSVAETAAPQAPAQPVVEIVPAAVTPSAGEVQPVTEADAQTEAGSGHGCGAKKNVYLTN